MKPRLAVKGQLGPYIMGLPLGAIGLVAGIALLDHHLVVSIFVLALAFVFLVSSVGGIYYALVPSYEVDKNGLTVLGVGLIPWEEIVKIDLVTVGKVTHIGVTVSRPEALAARMNKLHRLLTKSKTWPHRDVYLTLTAPISVSPQIVLKHISQYKEIV